MAALYAMITPVIMFGQTKFHNAKKENMQSNECKVVSKFLTAVQTGDMATVGALLHPEVQWNQPGASDISGKKHSAQEVFKMVGAMFEISGNTLKLAEIKWIGDNGTSVAALLHWTATKASGETIDVENIDVYTLEEGRIVAVNVYSSDIETENKFWKKR